MVIPRHGAEQNLIQYHERLTKQTHYSEAPNLATEIEMFSKFFFELQAMLEHFKDHQTTLKELRTMRTSLLENVKTINKEDRRLAQALSGNADEARKLRREAGRLRSYLQKHTHVSAQQLPAPIDDMNQRLASGQALSMEEFAAMLQHGGLTDLPSATKNNKGGKRKKTNNERRLPDEGRLEKESPIEREKVMRLEWVPCDSPKDLAPNQIAQIMQLFLNETGERYAEAFGATFTNSHLGREPHADRYPSTGPSTHPRGVVGHPVQRDHRQDRSVCDRSTSSGSSPGIASLEHVHQSGMGAWIQTCAVGSQSRKRAGSILLSTTWHGDQATTHGLLSIRLGLHDARSA